MKAKQIALILIPLNIILAYFVYNSINSEVEFQKVAKVRISENVQNLKDIRAVQIAYKSKFQGFADNFDSLMIFLNSDSIAVIKSEGEAPDSLTELQALEAGIISRDTIFVDAKSHVFNEIYKTIIIQKSEVRSAIKTLEDESNSITESVSSVKVKLNELEQSSTAENKKQIKWYWYSRR